MVNTRGPPRERRVGRVSVAILALQHRTMPMPMPWTPYACAKLKFLGNSESTQAQSLASLASLLTSHALVAGALPLTRYVSTAQLAPVRCHCLQQPLSTPVCSQNDPLWFLNPGHYDLFGAGL